MGVSEDYDENVFQIEDGELIGYHGSGGVRQGLPGRTASGIWIVTVQQIFPARMSRLSNRQIRYAF